MRSFPKPVKARSKPYLRWIRTQPCIVSGQSGAQAAHTWPSSIGSKSTDLSALPLIEQFHLSDREGLDKVGRETFELTHNLNLDKLVIEHLNRFVFEGHTF